MQILSISTFTFICVVFCEAHNDINKNINKNTTDPLILTPLIKAGKIKEARQAAEVKFDGFKHVKSYSGYFTVSEAYNSNMFFWFFPSETNYEKAPVVLWLQGGPGASSLYGLFVLNGPFSVKNKHGLKTRPYRWSKRHSVIYIDNPVGTGYSFTNKGGYAQNQTIIGEHLYIALLQFFQVFPELQSNDFFVTGESYAGKYVPALSYQIMKQNPNAKQKINLQGLAIGNGLCDPENQFGYADYLYQISLIDAATKVDVQKRVDNVLNSIHKQQWEEAYLGIKELILDDEISLFHNITGFNSHLNFLNINDTSSDNMMKYLTRADVKKTIHVGDSPFKHMNKEVADFLKSDFAQSVAPLLTELLNNYRVLLYSGQLDIIVPYPLTMNFVQKLKFKDADDYKTAKRHKWVIDDDIAGYVKQAGKFTELLVRNSGHLVPLDQPIWALDMISRFTQNKPFF